ncbi:MAG: RNA polymerase sigma factor [Saprospiraceae bacterium]
MSPPNTRTTMTTAELEAEWQQVQAAQINPAQFRPLYSRYYEPIFRFVFRRCADESLAADLCSQVFLKAMQQLKKYQFKGVPFSAWLYRIASNEVAQHFRKVQKNRVVSVEDETLNEVIDEIKEQPNEALQAALITALDGLKETDLQLVELRFFEQRPFKEIAEILGITESNAKVKTYRILERLKKRLTMNG